VQPPNSNPESSTGGNGYPTADTVNLPDGNHQPAEAHAPAHAAVGKPSSGTGVTLVISAIVVAALLGGAFFLVHRNRARTEADLASQTAANASAASGVDVVRVNYSAPIQPPPMPGETRAWYESTIYARVNGYLASWLVDIGDPVKKGQLLATIDTPELDDQLAAAQAKLKVSEADVAVAQANTVLAKSTYDRWWNSPKGLVSEQEQQEKKAEYDTSMAKVKAAESQVNLDQAEVQRLMEMTAFKKVVAPFDGVITARRIDIGDLITAGSTANTTSLYSIAQLQQVRVYVEVPQNLSAAMTVGTDAVAVAAQYPDRKFVGKIARTSSSIDPTAQTLKVEVDIPNPDLALLPGAYLQVSFELKEDSYLQVPASALLFRSAGPQVAVVDDQGVVHFHDISIARDQGEYVEVAKGLAPTDKVALNISSQVSDGDHVNAIDSSQPSVSESGSDGDTRVAAVKP
jgi:RND family efflux transporter MFP subunit